MNLPNTGDIPRRDALRLENEMGQVDCIYVAAASHDARYTRTCVASIRYFYPDVPIRLLIGGRLQRGLASELRRYWGVAISNVSAGDYGWGFVKLEALFGRPGEKFLVLDSDTVLAGPVLKLWTDTSAPFLVDEEQQSEAQTKALYYDWKDLHNTDQAARPPQFVFNTGQWFGTAGVLTRKDFAPWVEWSMPRRTHPHGNFKNGEQGLLNYVLNRKIVLNGLLVQRRQIMRWPGHSMDGLTPKTIAEGTAPCVITHWAGIKSPRQSDVVGADVLEFFEKFYYQRLPGGAARRISAICWLSFSYWCRMLELKLTTAFTRAAKRQVSLTK